MNRLIPCIAIVLLLVAAPTTAGPEKVKFPSGYKNYVLYTTVDRPDVKQYRELYATPAAIKAAKEGKPLPSGTVLTLVQYKAKLDEKGEPMKDVSGRFIKGDMIAIVVMEKRTGWGVEYPEGIRNGEWEYAQFKSDGTLNTAVDVKKCFECHKPLDKQDYVFSYKELTGTPK